MHTHKHSIHVVVNRHKKLVGKKELLSPGWLLNYGADREVATATYLSVGLLYLLLAGVFRQLQLNNVPDVRWDWTIGGPSKVHL